MLNIGQDPFPKAFQGMEDRRRDFNLITLENESYIGEGVKRKIDSDENTHKK